MFKRISARLGAMLIVLPLLGLITGPAAADDAGSPFGGLEAVATNDLANQRGTDLPFEFEDVFNAVLSGNTSTNNGATLTNTISSSFGTASGIATVVQNAGSNVIIQTATMVTVNFN